MENEKSSNKIGIKTVMTWIAVAIILAAIAYVYSGKYYSKQIPNTATSTFTQDQQNQILASVSKLIMLPDDETPSLAVINDAKSFASDFPFGKDAVNGDILLYYAKNQQAIIYSPSRNIIVNKGPVFVQNSATSSAAISTSATSSKK